MSKHHDCVTDFIEIYRSFPWLWKKTDPQYHNTLKKENACKILLKKYNEYDPNATKQSVLRKINSWRSAYNKEFKKIKEMEPSVVGTDDICSPSLGYYGLFSSFSKFT
jgi:hypothetical protein